LQLDSLADATSFCLAPAFLIFSSHLYKLDFVGILIVTVFLGAGLFRLARFNLISAEQSSFFLGIPTTFSGCFISSMILNGSHMKVVKFTYLLASITFILAFLMISHIKFPTFKKKFFLFKRKWQRNIFTTIFAIFVVMRFDLFLFLFLSFYLVGSLIYALILKIKYSGLDNSKILDIDNRDKI